MVIVGFGLQLNTKPGLVRFEIEGTATLTGKDEDIRKVLEVDAETKMPRILPRIYQHAFTAMYLLSTVLNTPPPPQDLLGSQRSQGSAENADVEVEAQISATTPQAETPKEQTSEPVAPAH